MRCKIMRTQELMWSNIMRSTKSQKVSILHYSIDRYQNGNSQYFFLLNVDDVVQSNP